MKKILSFTLFLATSLILLTSCGHTDDANVENALETSEPIRIEFSWDGERIEDNFDIEFLGDDKGDGYTINIEDDSAQIIVTSPDISFDLTYVYLPPVGVLNNLPECKVSIYENGDLKEEINSNNTSNLYFAPTGAVGFGICSVKKGKLLEYSGEWSILSSE